MKKYGTVQTILDLEKQLCSPTRNKSYKEFDYIFSNDFIEFGSSGRVYDKTQTLETLKLPALNEITIKEFNITELAPDVILAKYIAESSNINSGDVKRSLRSSIWKYTDEGWQIVFHQGTAAAE